MVKSNNTCAFGSSTKRFNNKGLHPNLGLSNEYSNIAPGSHQKLEEWGKKRIPGVKWTKSEVKEEIKMKLQMNFSNFMKDDKASTKTYTTTRPKADNDTNQTKQKSPTSKQHSKYKFSTPGPGSYGKGHIPSQRFEDWSDSRKVSVDFRSTKLNRYPEYLIAPAWKMTPAQYVVKDPGSIQALLDRRISAKGPYQLFTGERDETSLTGFIAAPKFKGSATMFYELPSEMNRLNHPSKQYVGRWIPLTDLQILTRMEKSRCEAKATQRHLLGNPSFVYRDPEEPGPAHYDPRQLGKIKYGFHPPFLCRDKSVRGMAYFIKIPALVKGALVTMVVFAVSEFQDLSCKVKFGMKHRKSFTETFELLKEAYGENALSSMQSNPGAGRYFPMDMPYVNGHQNVFTSRGSNMKTQAKKLRYMNQ